MYKLTLTHDERRAIDWIGGRYWHGDDFYKLLVSCEWYPNVVLNEDGNYSSGDWDSKEDITFNVPESVAWIIRDNLLEDNLACFGGELVDKLVAFHNSII